MRRQRVCFAGELAPSTAGATPVACSIHNLSAQGALIEVPVDAPLSGALATTRDGVVRRARTVWRRGKRRGLAFIGGAESQGRAPASALALRRSLKIVVAE